MRPIWGQALATTVYAMSREERWRREYSESESLPAYDEYLENGWMSIGVPPVLSGVLIAIDDTSVTRHVAHIVGHIRRAAICIRLANDLRSYRKELAEGNVNSVVLHTAANIQRGQSPDDALDSARRQVEAEVANHLAACERNAGNVRTETGIPEHAICSFAQWVCQLYQHTGFINYRPGTETVDHGWTSHQS
jgi:hypothetical protein